ncbi:MAG: 2-phosphosulfolactate phosphatase [Cytophagales bacterium]|nr:2-phosphosulfolactate phosphatase [Cytophagales bacterium]
MQKIEFEVCLTPELLHLHNLEHKSVVVVDILRATSCMVTAMAHGVAGIVPVQSLDECREYQNKGYICAAERDGKKIEGFELDNSPFSYMDSSLRGKTIAVTTTNGTQAILKSKKAKNIFIGSFLNLKAISQQLLEISNPILVVCSGWKGNFNIEDTLFAGALSYDMSQYIDLQQDAGIIAEQMYKLHSANLQTLVQQSSHCKRLSKLNIVKDIEYCLSFDRYQVVPEYKESIIKLSHV